LAKAVCADTRVPIIPRAILAAARILIAAYFLAIAAGLILAPEIRALPEPPILAGHLSQAVAVCLTFAAFLILTGRLVGVPALMLAVVIAGSGLNEGGSLAEGGAFPTLWFDLAVLGIILLMTLSRTEATAQFRLDPRAVALRRIAVSSAAVRRLPRPSPPCIGTSLVADDDPINLFSDIWDPPAVPPMACEA